MMMKSCLLHLERRISLGIQEWFHLTASTREPLTDGDPQQGVRPLIITGNNPYHLNCEDGHHQHAPYRMNSFLRHRGICLLKIHFPIIPTTISDPRITLHARAWHSLTQLQWWHGFTESTAPQLASSYDAFKEKSQITLNNNAINVPHLTLISSIFKPSRKHFERLN